MALPVIVVPPEPYRRLGTVPFNLLGIDTLAAMLLADLMVIIFVVLAWRSSKGWSQKVPARFQALAEAIGEFIYNQCKNVAGKNGAILFPLVATIFVFLLAVNWMKLLPGIESVGVMHCAGHSSPAIGINITAGHPKVGDRLLVTQALFSGYAADEEDYHACEQYKEGHVTTPPLDDLNTAAAGLETEKYVRRNCWPRAI
ncbi:MAG: F0F1 ATP synthase subunit A [Anaerolineae bacterium]